ncbi:MAG: cyclohexanecarboxylate-CoA ligase, partial [Rubrivivax sp.]|nr:cyclohexanecarboxylate-CoA ligase [Rubrivivax sp.]
CAVVVTAGHEPITLAEMRSYLEGEKLMKQKIPEQLELVAALPKNPTGKVLKKDLKGQFSARVPARA